MIKLFRAIRRAKALYQKEIVFEKYADEIDDQLRELGFTTGLLGSPMRHIGTAIKLIERYHLEFGIGTGYGQCRVDLRKENWDNPIREGVKSSEFGSFWEDQSHDEITHIYAYNSTLNDAVCQCLLYAHKAGVIKP